MNTILEVNELIKNFNNGKMNEISVLNGISCTIARGQKTAIVGESGSGKSTFLNIIGHLLVPDKGDIFLNSENTSTLNHKMRAQLRNKIFGYIFQEYALVEEDTVSQNVEIPLLYSQESPARRDRHDKIMDVLGKVGIPEKANEIVKNLSGGQRQRVAIARAIVNNPQIILADEPTGALDEKTGDMIMDLLDSLMKTGITLVIVTHNIKLARDCDKVYEIKNGLLHPLSTQS